jgi:hypothetical protein
VAGAEVVVDDCVELDPHPATHAATTATVMNRVDIDLLVLVFKILLPRSGWRLRADDEAKEGVGDGADLPHSGRRSSGLRYVEG